MLGGPALPLFAVCNSKKRGKVGGLGSFRERSQSQVTVRAISKNRSLPLVPPQAFLFGGPSLLFQKVNFPANYVCKKKSKKKG